MIAPAYARRRPLWRRRAETYDGERVLAAARALACREEHRALSDAELIRLAYWGASGTAPGEDSPLLPRHPAL